jgi:hypothetical protein
VIDMRLAFLIALPLPAALLVLRHTTGISDLKEVP